MITTKEVFSSEAAAANKIMLIFFQKKKGLVRCQNRMNEMNGNFVVHNSASLDLEITIA